ncbi:hypothetical protein EVAR_79639_1 [Eumeta japonica]|uniref:Uncharacterized protein n=1 Tax=Eumeta variegata TaxID=151549 RepID=A0A4C1W9S8_EUMVA|nr:hypothetical protein EVAR_79639_1 [Eumeta japonica]
MLRNLHQPKLYNGKRLVITKLMTNVTEAMILKGKFKGEEVLIPRIPMIPSDIFYMSFDTYQSLCGPFPAALQCRADRDGVERGSEHPVGLQNQFNILVPQCGDFQILS